MKRKRRGRDRRVKALFVFALFLIAMGSMEVRVVAISGMGVAAIVFSFRVA